MARQALLEKKTKNYKLIAEKLEDHLKKMFRNLIMERDELKQQVAARDAKLIEYERKTTRMATKIRVLAVKLNAAENELSSSEVFTKRFLGIAQQLAHDDRDKDTAHEQMQVFNEPASDPISAIHTPSGVLNDVPEPVEDDVAVSTANAEMDNVEDELNKSIEEICDSDEPIDQPQTDVISIEI